MVLCFPRLTYIIIQVDSMLHGLISMGILPHIECHHLSYLMNNKTISTIIKGVRSRKHGIKSFCHLFMTTQKRRQTFRIMEYTPGPMPGTAFSERSSPLGGVKVITPLAIGIPCPHETFFGIKQIAIVLCLFIIGFRNFLVSRSFCKTCQTPVSISIFQSFGSRLGHFRIRHIT